MGHSQTGDTQQYQPNKTYHLYPERLSNQLSQPWAQTSTMLRPQRTSPCHQWCHHVEQLSCYPSCTTTISTAIFTWSSPGNNWHEWTGISQCFLALHHLQYPTHLPSLFHLLQIYTIPTKNTTSWTIDTENTFWSNYLWLITLSKVLLLCCSRSTICLDQTDPNQIRDQQSRFIRPMYSFEEPVCYTWCSS